MDWVFASLVVGCLAYAGSILVEYTNYRTGLTPRIKQVEDGVLDVGLEFAAEEEAADNVRTRISRQRMHVDELRRHKTALFGRLVTERERKQRLEIAVFRKRLKSKQPLLSA
jgi:hypothetical protein